MSRTNVRMGAIALLAGFAVMALSWPRIVVAAAQSKPPVAGATPGADALQQAIVKLEAALVNRVADLLFEAGGAKDSRTELEKSRDALTIARLNLKPERAKLVQNRTATLKRWNEILKARSEGKDIRTPAEKVQENHVAALHRSTQYLAALKRLDEHANNRDAAILNGAPMTKLEQAVERLQEDLKESEEYRDACEDFRRLELDLELERKPPVYLRGWQHPGNDTPARLVAWSWVEAMVQSAFKR